MTSAAEAERFKELYDVERHIDGDRQGVLGRGPLSGVRRVAGGGPRAQGICPRTARVCAGRVEPTPRCSRVLRVLLRGKRHRASENNVFSSAIYSGFATEMFGRTIPGNGGRGAPALSGAHPEPSFSPKRIPVVDRRIGITLVDEAMGALEQNGRAALQCRAVLPDPAADDHRQLGLTRQEALDFREGAEGGGMRAMSDAERQAAVGQHERTTAMLRRIIEDRQPTPPMTSSACWCKARSRRAASATSSPMRRSTGFLDSSSPPGQVRPGASSVSS